MRRFCLFVILAWIATALRADLRFIGVLETKRSTYFTLEGRGPVRVVELGDRVDGWQLISYDGSGALSLRKDDELRVLRLPDARDLSSGTIETYPQESSARLESPKAQSDRAVAYLISWLRDIDFMKARAARKLKAPNCEDGSRLEAELLKLAGWEARATERLIVVMLEREPGP